MARAKGNSSPAFPQALDSTSVSYQNSEDTPLVVVGVGATHGQHVTSGSSSTLEMELEGMMQNRPRRVLLASLAALALLILGSLFLFSSLGQGSEGGGRGGEKEGVVEMDAIQAMTESEVRFNAGPDGKLGVCYDPAHNPAFPGDVARAFAEDFARISNHFRLVRTFYAVYYGTEVMPFITKAGLKAALGVSIANGRAEEEKAAAIRAYHANPDSIAAIYVGNEDLMPVGPFTADELIGHIQDLRNAGVKCPIGTAQRINEWVSPGPEIDKLAGHCDVIGVNLYPFFSSPHNDGEAWQLTTQPIENCKGQFNAVTGRFPGQEWKVRVTETGWPTGGERNFAGHDPSLEMSAKYFHDWVGWACSMGSDSYYYTAYDRWGGNPDYENFFGVMTAQGEPKFDLPPGGMC